MEPALRDKLKQLPETPGVYLFKDKEGKLLYVGKSNNLKRRFAAWFGEDSGRRARSRAIVGEQFVQDVLGQSVRGCFSAGVTNDIR